MTTPVTESAPISAVPDFVPFTESGSSGLTCEDCGQPFEYAGRGRKPKRCSNCRKVTQRRSSTTSRAQRPSIALLGQSITLHLQTFGSIVTLLNKYDGQVIMAGAPMFGNACANVAEHDARFRRFLEGSTSGIVYGELIAAAMIIVAPILANHGILPDSIVDNIGVMYANMNSSGSDGAVSGS